MRIGIFASGRGTNLQALLEAHADGRLRAEPAVVFSNRPDAPALERARSAGVPTAALGAKGFDDRDAYDRAVLDLLEGYALEGAVLAGYMRIVSGAFLAGFPAGVVNIHPSLLPSFKGIDAVAQAVAYGCKVTGCTVHFVDEQVDHGPIILQRCLAIGEDEAAPEVAARLLHEEHAALVDAVNLWASGCLQVVGRRVRITAG